MTVESVKIIGGLLLAAGGSSRLGRPKQLLQFDGKTLLRRAAETLVNSGCEPVVVVIGAEIEVSQAEISDLPVTVCINPDWRTGMSSSIKAGLAKLLTIEPALAAVLITLCDQPRVTSAHLQLFATQFRNSGDAIIAAKYAGTVGVPALFGRTLFNELSMLEGDKGARDLIRKLGTAIIKLEEAAFDIDTIGDLESPYGSK